MTLNCLFDLCYKIHWGKIRYIKSRWAKECRQNYNNHIRPTLGETLATDVKVRDIKQIQRRLRETPYAANRTLEVLSKMFVIGQQEEVIPVGCNPVILVPALPEKQRGRFASEDEIKKIIEILDREALTKPNQSAFCYALLYSGARPSALGRAKLNDLNLIDGGWGRLRIEGKSSADTGQKETVMLPPKIVQFIQNIKRKPFSESLFDIKSPTRFWNKVREEAGCKDLWLRDLRRTFASLALSNGVELDKIGEALNHSSVQTTKRYAKLFDGGRVEVATAVANSLQRLTNGQ